MGPIGVGVSVAVGVAVRVRVSVEVELGVRVAVRVTVRVEVRVNVRVDVADRVGVDDGVRGFGQALKQNGLLPLLPPSNSEMNVPHRGVLGGALAAI